MSDTDDSRLYTHHKSELTLTARDGNRWYHIHLNGPIQDGFGISRSDVRPLIRMLTQYAEDEGI